jgi:hypothetical protein
MKMAANNRGNEHSDSSNQKYRSKNVAFGIIGTSFVGTIFLISPFITMQLRSPLPYMATPKRKVIDALENIAKRKNTQMKSQSLVNKNIKKKLRYYDLGSGDGEAVLAASSTGRWRATGIELNSTLWTVSSIRRMVASPAIRRHSNFVWGNMWDHKIYDADAVMIFGMKISSLDKNFSHQHNISDFLIRPKQLSIVNKG